MSLAPQRPNFVLIWIGVVMLTFSMAGKWLMTEPVGVKKHYTTSDLGRTGEPIFSQATSSQGLLSGNLEPALSSIPNFPVGASDPRREELLPGDWDFAGLDEFTHGEGVPETLDQILAPTSKDSQVEEVEGTAGMQQPHGTQPDLQEIHHAWRPVEGSASTTIASKKSRILESGKLDSRWAGGHYGSRRAARKGGGPNQGIQLRTTVEPAGKGRLLVRFYLGNLAGAYSDLPDLLSQKDQLDAQMLRRAKQILQSMDQAVKEAPEETDTDNEADREKHEHLMRMRSKLVQHLRQRPGGVELVAELTPAQLNALMHKLSARSSELRALMEG